MSRIPVLGRLFIAVSLLSVVACTDGDVGHEGGSGQSTQVAQTRPATTEVTESTLVVGSETGVLDISWSPQPTVLALGGRARLQFALPAGYVSVSLSLGESAGVAARSVSTGRWEATVGVDVQAAGVATLSVDAVSASGRSDSASISVLVLDGFSDGQAEVVAGVDQELAVLPIGSGRGSVGYSLPVQGPAVGPTALVFDGATRTLAVLDSANRRLVILDMTGAVQGTVALEAEGALESLVSIGPAKLLVVAAGASNGEPFVVALTVDLERLTVSSFGPFLTRAWASGLSLFYSPSDDRVYVGFGGAWYPFFDVATESFAADLPAVAGPYGWARNGESGSAVGYVVDGVDMIYDFPGTAPGIEVDLPLNGRADWALVGVLDHDPSVDSSALTTSHYLTRFSLASGTAHLVDIDVPIYDHSKSFAVIDESTVAYMYMTEEGLAIHTVALSD